MADKSKDQEFSKRETQQRFEAALRGARVTGHKPKESIPPKRATSKKKKR